MMDAIHPIDDGRVGAVFEFGDNYEGEQRDTDVFQNDIESTLPPWICVLGAFAFIMPSFGESVFQSIYT